MKTHIKINSIKFNILLNMLYTLMNVAFPIITYPYVSRVLNPTGIGIVNFFTQIASYCTLVASLGLSTYGIRAVAKTRNDRKKLSITVEELLNINIVLTFFVILIYTILCIFIPQLKKYIALAVINGITIITAPLSLDWLYSGLEQFSYITKRDFLLKVISAVLIFIFVKNKNDYVIYAFILLLGNLGTTIFNFMYAHQFVDFTKNFKLKYRQHLKPMITLFASTLAVSVYLSLDTIMLGFINGEKQVGLYTTATKTETILLAVVNAISVTLLPRLSAYIEQKDYQQYNQILKKSISVIAIITFSLCCFFIITAQECVVILGGRAYLGATLSMQLLMPILIISGFSNITGNQVLIPQGKEIYFTRAVTAGAVVDILINLLVMKNYGAAGASFATLIAEFTQMSIQFYYSKDDILPNFDIQSVLKSACSVLLASLIVIIVKKYVQILPLLISMVVQAIVFFGTYLVFLFMFREKNTKELVLFAFFKIKSKF